MIATAAGERQQEMDPPSCTSERSARERLEPGDPATRIVADAGASMLRGGVLKPLSRRRDLAGSVH